MDIDQIAGAVTAVLTGASVDLACDGMTSAERASVVNLAAQLWCWREYEQLGEGLKAWRVLSLAGEDEADAVHAALVARHGRAAGRWIGSEPYAW
jgi:hypothetical protein